MEELAAARLSRQKKRVTVVGGGFGGIAAALRCRALGFEVVLLDRLSGLGGRAQVFEVDGFKHDAGPTVITAPFLFEELFQLFDENLYNSVTFKPLNPWYRFYFHDGRFFSYGGDASQMESEIQAFCPDDVNGYATLLEESRKIYEVGFTKLAHQPFIRLKSMIDQIPALIRLRADRSVSAFVNRHINDPMLRQAFSIQPLLVGGNPFTTTSIYSLIHYLERRWGIFFCMGGTGALVKALTSLMDRNGIKIKTLADVSSIKMNSHLVTEVVLSSGERIASDYVICNADPQVVYDELMPQDNRFATKRKRFLPKGLATYSMGLYVLFFGTKIQYPDICHHTIWMGPRFKSLLSDIFEHGKLSEDFSLYIHRPTATDSSFAPAGCDSFYVLCPVPNLRAHIDWPSAGTQLRDRIVASLSNTILPNLEKYITSEFWMDPTHFKSNYRSKFGAGFSLAPTFIQSAWFRFHNRDPHIENLFFVGAGTHPGAGLPGVLSSAKVVEKLISEQSLGKY